MKAPAFEYHDPTTLAEAIALLGRLENARPLAGGQSLMPMLNMRFVQPDHVVDLNRIAELSGISVLADGALEIGAMTRQRDIERDARVAQACPLMVEALAQVGHTQTRNRGTIGGSLCHMDPAAELPLVCAAVEAVVRIAGPDGVREMPFAEFPLGYMTPAVGPDELLVGLRLPAAPKGQGHAFLEFARRHGDFAVVAVAVLLDPAPDGRVARASVALGGVGPAPLRLAQAEALLRGTAVEDEVISRSVATTASLDPMEDALVPGWYRRHLAGVLLGRALRIARGRMA
ncbi:FAD binding domain-containing protein [Roseomonas sp. F4]